MASFVLSMANTFKIKYGTMQGYVGAIKEVHIQALGSMGNPLDGVLDWSTFMQAVAVQSYVDATVESHVMVPFMVMVRVLRGIGTQFRVHVALACMILMMYYTMSRSETPLPKSAGGFDPVKHLRRKDVRLDPATGVVQWAFGVTKSSTRAKKAANDASDKEWKTVGPCTGVLSMAYWVQVYLSMSHWESDDDPFFYDEHAQPYVYVRMLREFRTLISFLSGFAWDSAKIYGFHGLRVLGFNCTRAAAGEHVAVLQGGWMSDAFKTYSREQIDSILAAPQIGANYAATRGGRLPSMPMDGVPVPLSALPTDGPLPPPSPVVSTSVPAPVPRGPAAVQAMPVDAVQVTMRATKRHYKVWRWLGRSFGSKPRLLRAYRPVKEFLGTLAAMPARYFHVAAPDEPTTDVPTT